MPISIQAATEADRPAIQAIHEQAFGTEEGPEIVQLLAAMAIDPTAQPQFSFVAWTGDRPIGHILFTPVQILPPNSAPGAIAATLPPLFAQILAPLAVVPEYQKQGVGGQLITIGGQALAAAGVQLVFVLGYPDYYSRHGFQTAAPLGYATPYPILPHQTEAWRVRELAPGAIDRASGTVHCCQALSQPHYW